jgi:acyl-coenzyme A thioesterase PaaI-like protein
LTCRYVCAQRGPRVSEPRFKPIVFVTGSALGKPRPRAAVVLAKDSVLSSLVDVACGYAALSLMPADREVSTVEFKINFMKPAKTDRLIAVGKVMQSGRRLTVCEGSAFDATRTRAFARTTATMIGIVSPSEPTAG